MLYYCCHEERCEARHAQVKMGVVDEYVVSSLRAYLRDPDQFTLLVAEPTVDEATIAAEAERVAVDNRRAVLEGRRAELGTA
jgi:hypothetical protein